MLRRFLTFIIPLLCLSVSTVYAQTATPPPAFPITPGKRVEGNITASAARVRYTFSAQSGDQITISMDATSGDLDPYLFLFAPNGDLLQQNDDAVQGSRNAQITFTLPSTGAYIIEATRVQQEDGQTTGTYRLTLSQTGAPPTQTADPLSVPPSFGVNFTYIDYQQPGAGTLPSVSSKQYFAIGGKQGDLVRVTLARTTGDLVPQVNILNKNLAVISREAQTTDTQAIVYATLPVGGWYLIETASRSGAGNFSLYVDRRAVALLEVGQTVTGQFTPQAPSISYIFTAHIGDSIFANLTSSGSNVVPELRLLNLSLENIARNLASTQNSAQVRTIIPRSGTYILVANNVRDTNSGSFTLNLTSAPVDISKLPVQIASYNETYHGTINDDKHIAYYRFAGKAGELVTIEMDSTTGNLDPYLILTDSQLNELIFNDNSANTSNARITQFALPQDGDYYILATRAGLAASKNRGGYNLSLTVGKLSLLSGVLTATLTWSSEADLNLFVRDPDGRTVSWSNPRVASGGTLQIDSNTRCQTLTDQPVEHIYWAPSVTLPDGSYQVWVWYQNVCMNSAPTTFALTLTVGGKTVLDIKPDQVTLQADQRFETSFRQNGSNTFVLDPGHVTSPSAQQRASQGGDTLILYGQNLTGTINDDVYAQFYQFVGRQGDQVAISVDKLTGDLDPIVVLRDDADNNLAANDDADATTSNSKLTYTLPKDGQYVIAVTRFGARDGTTTGDYRVTLTKQR